MLQKVENVSIRNDECGKYPQLNNYGVNYGLKWTWRKQRHSKDDKDNNEKAQWQNLMIHDLAGNQPPNLESGC
jgi:hypothetical protein